MTNRPDLIAQLEKLTLTEGEWSSVKDVDFPFITIGDCSLDTDYLMNDDIDLITLAPTMRNEILAMAKEIEELKSRPCLTATQLTELKRIRNYFAEKDRTTFEHHAYNVLDKINKP